MKRLILILALLAAPACHAPVTITTPQGQAAYQADQVIGQLAILSQVVIADTGNGAGQIWPKDAYVIIAWISGDANAVPPTTGIVQLVQTEAGQGWKWPRRCKAGPPTCDRFCSRIPSSGRMCRSSTRCCRCCDG